MFLWVYDIEEGSDHPQSHQTASGNAPIFHESLVRCVFVGDEMFYNTNPCPIGAALNSREIGKKIYDKKRKSIEGK